MKGSAADVDRNISPAVAGLALTAGEAEGEFVDDHHVEAELSSGVSLRRRQATGWA